MEQPYPLGLAVATVLLTAALVAVYGWWLGVPFGVFLLLANLVIARRRP